MGTLQLFCHTVCVRLDIRRRPDSSPYRFPLRSEVLAHTPRRLTEETGEEKVVLASPFNLMQKFPAGDCVIFQDEHEFQCSRTAGEVSLNSGSKCDGEGPLLPRPYFELVKNE